MLATLMRQGGVLTSACRVLRSYPYAKYWKEMNDKEFNDRSLCKPLIQRNLKDHENR